MPAHQKQTVSQIAHRAQTAAATIRKEKKEIVLTDKNRRALELMVFDGLRRPAAAEAVGLTDHALRSALTKPHVLAALNEMQEVLRTSLRPRALHTMGELLDAKNESTKFKAAEYLDGQNRGSHTIGATQVNITMNQSVKLERAGYVIDLTPYEDEAAQAAPQITHLEHDEDK